jgi:uncharacterized protein YraI
MSRNFLALIVASILTASLAGCFAATPGMIIASEEYSESGQSAESTATTAPIAGVSLTPEPISNRICLVTVPKLNVRSGPSTEQPRVSTLSQDAQFAVTGSNNLETWYYGSSAEIIGWISAEYVDCYADVASLPTLAVPTIVEQTTPVPVAAYSFDVSPVTLLEPLEPALCGRRTFRWIGPSQIEPNQMFELVFWPSGGDPVSDGFSPVGAQRTSEVDVDLSAAAEYLDMLMNGKDYEWGILLVGTDPYERIRYLGGGHPFRLRSQAECDADAPIPVLTGVAQPAYPND